MAAIRPMRAGIMDTIGVSQTSGRAHMDYIRGNFSDAEAGGVMRSLYARSASINRARMVAVPNVGASAALLSFRYIDAKISLGYRADFLLWRDGHGYRHREEGEYRLLRPLRVD